ncbi:hypothetical protein GQ457_09G011580 [Hibiscus cannabinus]
MNVVLRDGSIASIGKKVAHAEGASRRNEEIIWVPKKISMVHVQGKCSNEMVNSVVGDVSVTDDSVKGRLRNRSLLSLEKLLRQWLGLFKTLRLISRIRVGKGVAELPLEDGDGSRLFPMKFLFLNTRGFNDPKNRLLFFLGYKVCKLNWLGIHNNGCAVNGRIWFLWKPSLSVNVVDVTDQCITCSIDHCFTLLLG